MESVGHIEYTARAVEALLPALLAKPMAPIGDADIFAFRNARLREGMPRQGADTRAGPWPWPGRHRS